MRVRCGFVVMLTCVMTSAAAAQARPKLDTAAIDARLGRSGSSVGGMYVTFFPRPGLSVLREGVRLTTAQVVSFVTFMGGDDNADMMGEICALPEEQTAAIAGLRAAGFQVTGAHDHFLGETPHIMFVHFMGHGRAAELAKGFRAALGTTKTPLAKPAAMADVPEPDWSKAVRRAIGRAGTWLGPDQTLEIDVPSADFKPGPMDFWYTTNLYFQQASGGRVAGTGDIIVTARELNPVLSALLANHFQIESTHNHMIDEQPRVFFVHYWKIGTPKEVADGLNATLAAVHTRK